MDGTTFSIRCAVTSQTGKVGRAYPVYFPALGKHNSLADGTRTATLKLLVDNNIKTALGSRDPKAGEMWIEIGYVGTDGAMKFVTTEPAIESLGSALTAGNAADWTSTSYDVNGVSHSYSAYEIAVSLPDVETLTQLSLVFVQAVQTASVDDLVILDPEWGLA